MTMTKQQIIAKYVGARAQFQLSGRPPWIGVVHSVQEIDEVLKAYIKPVKDGENRLFPPQWLSIARLVLVDGGGISPKTLEWYFKHCLKYLNWTAERLTKSKTHEARRMRRLVVTCLRDFSDASETAIANLVGCSLETSMGFSIGAQSYEGIFEEYIALRRFIAAEELK